EERAHCFVSMQIYSSNFTRPVVQIEIDIELVVVGLCVQLLRRSLLSSAYDSEGVNRAVAERAEVLYDVVARTIESLFLAAPKSYANRAARLKLQCLKNSHGFHSRCYASAVVCSARAG